MLNFFAHFYSLGSVEGMEFMYVSISFHSLVCVYVSIPVSVSGVHVGML